MQAEHPKFVGHTEYLANGTHSKDVTMMFASDAPCMAGFSCPTQPLRIALATTHVSIKDVSKNLSSERIMTTIKHLCCALQHLFGCEIPRIGVMALNPHAGDEGALGSEEQTIIGPAIEMMRKEGCTCIGPLVPDRVFSKINQIDFDGVVAMYHDQGLIPMKLLYGMNTVNITLGLPFVRTSPAHGTAEDIAWRDMASPESMLAAIDMAEKMANTTNCIKND
jgi:4-hydroxythreonine-4-phosphate dehydrogenase